MAHSHSCIHTYTRFLIWIFVFISSYYTLQAQWQPKVTPIKTPWTDQVDASNPLPEYPRPQLVRDQWMNLNGYWEYKSGIMNDPIPHDQTLSGKILVPYPVESTLSGVTTHTDRLWYRRMITIPTAWSGKRVLIHFGAIDWESEVFVNGASLGIHRGGYDEIVHDITDQLIGTGPQEIIVRVYDPTKDYGQPRGKQSTNPSGNMYTSVTGIWQSVWMEPVSPQSISSLTLIPDIDNNRLKITVNSSDLTGLTITATAKDGGAVIGTVTGNANTQLYISIPNAKLWSPDSPFLYDLSVELKKGGTSIDIVSSYFGMRKIAIDKNSSTPKIYLNNKPIFMMGILDQGFWPDGIYTAPTDDALRSDIEQEKALGFNMVRKHLKVESQRWYYWADKLGIMVWQDMPSANSYDAPANIPVDQAQFNIELERLVDTHINSPSIVMWVVFNELQGQFDAAGRSAFVKTLDPSRLVNQGSGDLNGSTGDILDGHYYTAPQTPSSTTQAVACGGFGGIGLATPNHQWGDSQNPYESVTSADALISRYTDYTKALLEFKTTNSMSAAVYTEITDVEGEINGMLTYDRILKIDAAKMKALNQQIITGIIAAPTPTQYTSPLDKTRNTDINTVLQWTAGSGVTGYKVYLGTSSVLTDADLKSTQTALSYSAQNLKMATTYYWKVDAVNASGTMSGPVWSFTSRYHGVVIVYSDCNYGSTAIGMNVGEYTLAQMNAYGITNNDISALKVSEGFKVILYDGDNFTGTSKELTSNTACLTNVDNANWSDIATSFKILPNGATNMGGIYTLQNRNSGLNMEVIGGVTGVADGAILQQNSATDKTNQQFQFTHLGNGLYKITALHSGKAIDINQNSSEDLASVLQWTYKETANQQFVVWPTGDGYYKLIGKYSGKLIQVANASMAPAIPLQQYTNTNNYAGQWKMGTIRQGLTTPIDTKLISEELLLYPNPAESVLMIQYGSEPLQNLTYIIYDVSGKQQLSGMISETASIDVEALASGLYYIHLNGNNESVIKSFVRK